MNSWTDEQGKENTCALSVHLQMKHQYSAGKVKHTVNFSGMVKTCNCPTEKRKSARKYRTVQVFRTNKTLSGQKWMWHISPFLCAACNPANWEKELPHPTEAGLQVKDNWIFLIRCPKSVMQLKATLLECLLNPLQAEMHSQTGSIYWQVKETESPQQGCRYCLKKKQKMSLWGETQDFFVTQVELQRNMNYSEHAVLVRHSRC